MLNRPPLSQRKQREQMKSDYFARIFFCLFGLIFAAGGAQTLVMSTTPAQVNCRYINGSNNCEVKRPDFPFKTVTQSLDNVVKVEIAGVRSSTSKSGGRKYKLQMVNAFGKTADLDAAGVSSGKKGKDARESARGNLNSLLAKGRDFSFSYTPEGSIVFGAVFVAVGLITLFLSFTVKGVAGKRTHTMPVKIDRKTGTICLRPHPDLRRKLPVFRNIADLEEVAEIDINEQSLKDFYDFIKYLAASSGRAVPALREMPGDKLMLFKFRKGEAVYVLFPASFDINGIKAVLNGIINENNTR